MNPQSQTAKSQKLSRRADDVLRPRSGLLGQLGKSRRQREAERQSTDRILEVAREVQQAQSAEAARVCRLNDQYEQEDEHNLRVIEHREAMMALQSGGNKAGFKSAVDIMAAKSHLIGELNAMQGIDDERRDKVVDLIAEIHRAAAQRTLALNQDAVAPEDE
ncbi:hypothetical protein [Aporhodopirellula aestuarii]|uniref:Uncharacterized protein n=1 Tax=Aporhodopirellula aestuarii TaxID=2950107 RepID=A0ABT0UBS1_9BACT|nr:hypothetical protein [Aporhodopirellula aestuarii]MCM2374443.1 hypothetical protein [Aporhodopirellula aestuarii]